jgi:hypothetical protein
MNKKAQIKVVLKDTYINSAFALLVKFAFFPYNIKSNYLRYIIYLHNILIICETLLIYPIILDL